MRRHPVAFDLRPSDTTVAAHTSLSHVDLIDVLLNSYCSSYWVRSW